MHNTMETRALLCGVSSAVPPSDIAGHRQRAELTRLQVRWGSAGPGSLCGIHLTLSVCWQTALAHSVFQQTLKDAGQAACASLTWRTASCCRQCRGGPGTPPRTGGST